MSTKSAVHIASVPEENTLLFLIFFPIGWCSSAASSLLHSIPQPSFLFVPIMVRTSFLSIFSRMHFGSNTSSSCSISSSHACFPPSFRCLDSRYNVAMISHPRRCKVLVQPTVDRGRLIVRVVGYTVLYTCDMVLQSLSLCEAAYQ